MDDLQGHVDVVRCAPGESVATRDVVAVEEPCEIRVNGEAVAVVMRTPGHDHELAAGFLHSEAIVERGQIGSIRTCDDSDALDPDNVVDVRLVEGVEPSGDWQRNFYAASSCGICGKASIDAIRVHTEALEDDTVFERSAVCAAVPALRARQPVFEKTGGLHAAGLFDASGRVLVVREDVGRHNAVDKIVGWAYLRELLPLRGHMLVVSGRQSFEIVQKAAVARIPLLAGVSAASSLAVELASELNLSLAGFVRGDSLVVYAGAHRIVDR